MAIRTALGAQRRLLIRQMPVEGLVVGVRAALQRADPSLPVVDVTTMDHLIDRALFARRFVAWLIGGFALFGLARASLGLDAVTPTRSRSGRTRWALVSPSAPLRGRSSATCCHGRPA
jgi:hypothetical protein